MKRRILAILLSISLLILAALPVAGTFAGDAETPAPEETPVATEKPEETREPDPTAEPAPTAEPTVAPTAEPEVTEEPTAEPTAEPEVTEEPTAEPTAEPEVTEEPTAEPTEEPDVTAEPTVEPTEEPVSPLQVKLISEVSYAFANEDSIDMLVTIAEGKAPYDMKLKLNGEDVQLYTDIAEAGTYAISYKPTEFGEHTLKAVVMDADGNKASSVVKVPVAVREIEREESWRKDFYGIELTGDWQTDLLAIARTQIGYAESERNFIVDDDGKIQGYTRYGQWYGSSYADWCAMFVSFCLNYAGIPDADFPYEANPAKWKDNMQWKGVYEDDENSYAPQAGDMIFFNYEDKNTPQHIGIVSDVDDTYVYTIEGNNTKKVVEARYALTDKRIVGYSNTEKLEEMAKAPETAPDPDPTAEPVPALNVVSQPANAPWQVGAAEVGFNFVVENAVDYVWQASTDGAEWIDIPGTNNAGILITATIDNMKLSYRCVATGAAGETAVSDVVTVVSGELTEWINSVDVSMEMLVRAMNANSLNSLVLEDGVLISVYTGEPVADFDAESGKLIDRAAGITVAIYDAATQTFVPVAYEDVGPGIADAAD